MADLTVKIETYFLKKGGEIKYMEKDRGFLSRVVYKISGNERKDRLKAQEKAQEEERIGREISDMIDTMHWARVHKLFAEGKRKEALEAAFTPEERTKLRKDQEKIDNLYKPGGLMWVSPAI